MTNIFATPEKEPRRNRLFQIGLQTLRQNGWKVERIPGIGKSSVRQITKGGVTRKVSIRTSQDTWIAFPRNKKDNAWATLSDVDVVVAVSIDDYSNPKFAQVHMIEADEMRERFDRAYAARIAAGYQIQLGRGIWVSLYHPDETEPVNHVGAGAGLDHPPIARVPLDPDSGSGTHVAGLGSGPGTPVSGSSTGNQDNDNQPLTIAEAKRRLAVTLGVDPSSIKITVEA